LSRSALGTPKKSRMSLYEELIKPFLSRFLIQTTMEELL
jgi:hypothetical protein